MFEIEFKGRTCGLRFNNQIEWNGILQSSELLEQLQVNLAIAMNHSFWQSLSQTCIDLEYCTFKSVLNSVIVKLGLPHIVHVKAVYSVNLFIS